MTIYYLTIISIIALDQFTKYLTVKRIPLFETHEVIPKFLSITHIHNSGAAWSILEGKMTLFYILTSIIVLFLFIWLHKEGRKNFWLGFSISMMIGGALGNFIDRVAYQYVIDMFQLDFMNFPIFNIADIALTLGTIILLLHTILEEEGK